MSDETVPWWGEGDVLSHPWAEGGAMGRNSSLSEGWHFKSRLGHLLAVILGKCLLSETFSSLIWAWYLTGLLSQSLAQCRLACWNPPGWAGCSRKPQRSGESSAAECRSRPASVSPGVLLRFADGYIKASFAWYLSQSWLCILIPSVWRMLAWNKRSLIDLVSRALENLPLGSMEMGKV